MTEPLVGRYQLVREIGRGGFGAVEEYKDLIIDDERAIKTIAPHFIHQEAKRIIREIDIMAFLYNAHPNVITFDSMFITRCKGGAWSQVSQPAPPPHGLQVLGSDYAGLSPAARRSQHHARLSADIESVRSNEPFSLHIVMPLMKGDLTSFSKLLSSESAQRRIGVTRHYVKQTATVFAFQLFYGLDYLHKCGIVHRDLKPENILVRMDNKSVYDSLAVIADLGLARDSQVSETFYVCTRYYRPPEVIMTTRRVSQSIDIWSMGCILYEMCTGNTLFSMPTALDSQGAWDGGRASTQLEVILNTIGTPAPDDLAQYMPSGNAKMYLMRSQSRPSQLLRMLRENWLLATDATEQQLWIDLIVRCLAFFPEQRPSAEELCSHELFTRAGIAIGRNVRQPPAKTYRPVFDDNHADSDENKKRILFLIRTVMNKTKPPAAPEGDYMLNEEIIEDDGDDDDDSDDDNGSNGRLGYMDDDVSAPAALRYASLVGKSRFDPDPIDRAPEDDDEEEEGGTASQSRYLGSTVMRRQSRGSLLRFTARRKGSELAQSRKQPDSPPDAALRHESMYGGGAPDLTGSAFLPSMFVSAEARHARDGSSAPPHNARAWADGADERPAPAVEAAKDLALHDTPSLLRSRLGASHPPGSNSGGNPRSVAPPRVEAAAPASRGATFNEEDEDDEDDEDADTYEHDFQSVGAPVEAATDAAEDEEQPENVPRGSLGYQPSMFNFNGSAANVRTQRAPSLASPASTARRGGPDVAPLPSFSGDGVLLSRMRQQAAPPPSPPANAHLPAAAPSQMRVSHGSSSSMSAYAGSTVAGVGGTSMFSAPRGAQLVRQQPSSAGSSLVLARDGREGKGVGGAKSQQLIDGRGRRVLSAGPDRNGIIRTSTRLGGEGVPAATYALIDEYDYFNTGDYRVQQQQQPQQQPQPRAPASQQLSQTQTILSGPAALGTDGGVDAAGVGAYPLRAAPAPLYNPYFSAANLTTMRQSEPVEYGAGDGGLRSGSGPVEGLALNTSSGVASFRAQSGVSANTAEEWAVPPLSPPPAGRLGAGGIDGDALAAATSANPVGHGSGIAADSFVNLVGLSVGALGSGVSLRGAHSRALANGSGSGANELDAAVELEDGELPYLAATHDPRRSVNNGAHTSPAATTAGEDADFPVLSDGELRAQYRSVETTERGAQDAISSILSELGSSGSSTEGSRAQELRELLTYFTSLQYALRGSQQR